MMTRTVALLASFGLGGGVWAQPLSETEVIARAKAHDAAIAHTYAVSDLAKAAADGAHARANPQLTWHREVTPSGAGAQREQVDDILLELPVTSSGERPGRIAAARLEHQLAVASSAQRRSDRMVWVLAMYYEAIAAQHLIDLHAQATAQLQEALRVVSRRLEAGVVSGTDQTRLAIEHELAASDHRAAIAHAHDKREALALLLMLPIEQVALPTTWPRIATTSPKVTSPTMAATALDDALGAAEAGERAAAWSRLPSLSLQAGVHTTDEPSRRWGYVIGIGAELPLFSKAGALASQAHATTRMIEAERRTLTMELTRQQEAAQRRLALARSELADHEAKLVPLAEVLTRTTLRSYGEGATTTTQLLEAYRLQTQLAKRRLQLQLDAALADVALRAAQGEFQ